VAPSASSFDPVAAAAGYGRSTTSVDDNAIAVVEPRRETGIAVAARYDFRARPDIEADLSESATVFICSAAGKKNSRPIDFFRQFGKNRVQTLALGKAKIRRWQFSLLEKSKFRARRIGYRFDKHPCGLRAATFHSEDALTGFHDCVWIAVV
jgi:hypothetical protein